MISHVVCVLITRKNTMYIDIEMLKATEHQRMVNVKTRES